MTPAPKQLSPSFTPLGFRRVSLAMSGIVLSAGLMVLSGWALDVAWLKSILPGLATMKANTAICFVLSAAALGLVRNEQAGRWRKAAGWAAAAAVLGIAGTSLAENISGWNAGIDQLVFIDRGSSSSPGRMSGATAICFILAAMSVLAVDVRKPISAGVGQTLALAMGFISYLALLGYVFNVSSLYQIGIYSSMALHTAACFALLSVGLLCVRPQYAMMKPVACTYSGGWMARRFIVVTLVLPLVLGGLRLLGEMPGHYDGYFGLMLVIIGMVIGFIAMTWLNAWHMNKADEQLHQLCDIQGDILAALPTNVALLNEAGAIVAVNESWRQFVADNGYQGESSGVGENYLAICRGGLVPDATVVEKGVAAALSGDVRTFTTEYARMIGNKQRWYHLTIASLDRGGERGVVVLHYDLTERKQLEEQLMQSQKMESIGNLAGGVAHDFNNMLTIILGYAELAAGDLKPEHPASESLVQIQSTCERAAALSKQLLSFARKQVIAPRRTNLNDLVTNVEKMIRRVIDETIQITAMTGEELWDVNIDPGQFEQVLVNLAVNARDAMPGGGRLRICTSNVTLDETYTRQHTTITPGDYVLLTVSDTGTGMTPEVLKKIFEPFFTTKAPGQGTGLGLATCYGIIKQAGGDIWVYSEVGRGTTFKIYLPRLRAAGEVAAEKPGAERPLNHGHETILLVEDDALVRKITMQTLGRLGYTVLEAEQGSEAFEIARVHEGEIHLLLTDVMMPHYNGREVAERVKALRPNIALLFMSGYSADVIANHGVLEQGVLLVQKPFTGQSLSEKVRQALDQVPNPAATI